MRAERRGDDPPTAETLASPLLGPARGRAPGKLILFGEHAVVYGHPALALAVDRGTTVELELEPGPRRLVAGPMADPRLEAALDLLLPAQGLSIRIETELPVGRGMGSSASLAVALVRARALAQGRRASLEECIEEGFRVERVFHGQPSGVDHTVCARGGAVRYRRGAEGLCIESLALGPLPLVVLDTGRAGHTGALVAAVAARRPAVDPILAEIGALVERCVPLLAEGALPALGEAMTENQALLRALGVSAPENEALVAFALAQGALGAKLAGAGGGGVVLALHPQPAWLLDAAREAGISAFPVSPAPSEPARP